ncbi:Uncharacterised protein [Mycobacteroides abscessus subsp. abscessus]|nr:Uncharacterised protein [Mycobacteroides abscessus subsp. abscessus]
MGGAHGEFDGDVGPDEAREVGEVADRASAHLEDEELRLLVGAQRGERDADLVVVRVRGPHRRAGTGEEIGGEVLDGGLADRAGDGDDAQLPGLTQRFDAAAGELPERLGGVGDEDRRQRAVVDGGDGFADDERGTGLHGGGGELDAVEVLSAAGDVDVTGADFAGVGDDSGAQQGFGVDAVQLAVDGGCDLGCTQSLHINCELYLFRGARVARSALSVSSSGRRIR